MNCNGSFFNRDVEIGVIVYDSNSDAILTKESFHFLIGFFGFVEFIANYEEISKAIKGDI